MTIEKTLDNLDAAIDAVVEVLLKDWEVHPDNCYWVNDDRTGVLCVNDELFLNLGDVVYIIEECVPMSECIEWQDYNVKAQQWGFNNINLQSWHKGCPRVSQDIFDRLQKMQDNISDLIDIEKNKIKTLSL